MSIRRAASNVALAAGIAVASLVCPARSASAEDALRAPAPAAESGAVRIAPVAPPVAMLIVRVFVNTVSRGDIPVLRDASGHFFVPQAEFERWSLAVPRVEVVVAGERY